MGECVLLCVQGLGGAGEREGSSETDLLPQQVLPQAALGQEAELSSWREQWGAEKGRPPAGEAGQHL